jgi:L-fuconolactonase
VVIDHLLHIPAAEGVQGEPLQKLLALAQHPNVYVKVSNVRSWAGGSYPYPASEPLLKAVTAAFGAGRLMWGSDWPHVRTGEGYVRCLDLVRRGLPWLSDAERAQILGGTARTLWHFGG